MLCRNRNMNLRISQLTSSPIPSADHHLQSLIRQPNLKPGNDARESLIPKRSMLHRQVKAARTLRCCWTSLPQSAPTAVTVVSSSTPSLTTSSTTSASHNPSRTSSCAPLLSSRNPQVLMANRSFLRQKKRDLPPPRITFNTCVLPFPTIKSASSLKKISLKLKKIAGLLVMKAVVSLPSQRRDLIKADLR